MTIRAETKNGVVCAVIESDTIVITDTQSALDVLISAKYDAGTNNIVIDSNFAPLKNRIF